MSERIIELTENKISMQWLKVYFDSFLSISDHVIKMATKKGRAAPCLSILVKITREAEANIICKVVHACILPILTYDISAW